MFRELRNRSGGPNLRVRFVALLLVLGLVALTAPLVVLPLAKAVADALW